MREELDEMKEFKMEYLTGMTKEERDMLYAELDEMDAAEELEAVAEAEKMEVAAEYLEDSASVDGAENRTDVAVEHLEDLQAVVKTENRIEVAAEYLCLPFGPQASPCITPPATLPLVQSLVARRAHNLKEVHTTPSNSSCSSLTPTFVLAS